MNISSQDVIEFVGEFPSPTAISVENIEAEPPTERLQSDKYSHFNVTYTNFKLLLKEQ